MMMMMMMKKKKKEKMMMMRTNLTIESEVFRYMLHYYSVYFYY